ncbi:MAG: PEGA domain-containing protein [bacterium]|nr:PEGA domain-containing protein [bacterium]
MSHLPTLLMLFLALSPFEVGSLRIESQPGVEVVWEGVPLGSTDARGILTVDDSPLGVFSITLRKPGFRSLTTEIEIAPGRKTLALELEPTLTAADPRASPAPAPPPAKTPPSPSGEELEKRAAVEATAPSPEEAGTATAESVAEDPAAPRPEPAPPPTAPTAPATIASGTAMKALYLLGAAVLGAIVLTLVRRRRARPPLPAVEPAGNPPFVPLRGNPFAADPPSEGLEPLAGTGSGQARTAAPFLEDLKRRERALEDRENAGTGGADDDIIDVEATEVRPGELGR